MSVSIPKIIHYCWFGGKKIPAKTMKCIDSWKRFLPEYDIIKWDESNFDPHIIPYTSRAYNAGKYAFVSDYARLWILFNHGGLYFDTDVEIIKDINEIVQCGPFLAREPDDENSTPLIGPGLGMGAGKENPTLEMFLRDYEKSVFNGVKRNIETETIVKRFSEYFIKKGLKNDSIVQNIDGFSIYAPDYFCPYNNRTGHLRLTANSVSIHHYDASWKPASRRFKNKIKRLLGHVF